MHNSQNLRVSRSRPRAAAAAGAAERRAAERKLTRPDLPEAARFTWKPRGRPEQVATLIADWQPEVEARFSLETGEQPRADASALID